MPLVDLMDETFIVVDPATLAARLRDPELVRRAWPGLDLVVFMDRGEQGIRWSLTGALVGSCEIWLEPFRDGVIVHYFLRADPPRRASRARVQRIGREHATRWKAVLNAVKDELEAGRPAGEGRIRPETSGPATPNGSRGGGGLPRTGA